TAWLALIQLASQVLGRGVSLREFSGSPPDDPTDFAYIADSAALSRKLWLQVPVIYIQPRSAPAIVDPYLYWKMLERSGSSGPGQPASHAVSLISSVFRGDEFLPDFLENCARLHGYRHCEHV